MFPSFNDLLRYKAFIAGFNKESAAFEYLISSVFSQIFYLPFRCSKKSRKNSLTWHGEILSKNQLSNSPSGPDASCCAYGFNILIEATLRTEANQWRREFMECLKHYDKFVRTKKICRENVYLILVAPKLHADTYDGFKQKVSNYNLILLSLPWLTQLWETILMVPTIRHIDFRTIFMGMVKQLHDSPNFRKYQEAITTKIAIWQEEVLNNEKEVFFALRAYEAMKKTGGNVVSMAQVLYNLRRDDIFNRYWTMMGKKDLTSIIKDYLLSEKMAVIGPFPDDETYFCRVNALDFRRRSERVIKSVEEIND